MHTENNLRFNMRSLLYMTNVATVWSLVSALLWSIPFPKDSHICIVEID